MKTFALSKSLGLGLLVTGLALAPACKDDEPATPATPAAPEGGTPGAEAGKAGAGTPGETKPGEAPAAPGAEAARPAAGAATSRAAVTVPDDVILIAGVPSLKAVLQTASDLGQKLAPGEMPPDLTSLALEGLKETFGLTDITWLETEKPCYVYALDPKTHGSKGQGLVLPMAGKDKVLAALKPEAKKDVDGHAASFEHQFTTWYVDFTETHAVFADHPQTFPDAKALVTGPLAGWTPERLLSLQVNMNAINRIFGPEIEGAKQSAMQLMGQAASEPGMPDMKQIMEKEVSMLFDLVASTERVDVDLWVEGQDAKLGFAFTGKEGSGLAKFASTIAGKSSGLVDAAPATTWLGFSSFVDMRGFDALKELQTISMNAYAGLLHLTPEETAKLKDLMGRVSDLSTGESVTAFYSEGTFPLAMTSLVAMRDGAEARKIYGEVYDLLWEKGWAWFKEFAKGEGMELPGAETVKTLDDLVAAANTILAPAGAKVAVVKDDKDGVEVRALTFEVDWDKLGIKEKDPDTYALLDGIVGRSLQLAIAFKDQWVAAALGPKAMDAARSLASGNRPGGEKSLTDASRGNAMAMTVHVDKILKVSTFIPEMQAKKAAIDALPADRPFVFTGTGADRTFAFTLSVPTDLVKALTALGM